MSTADVWAPAVGISANTKRVEESFVALEGQTLFDLTTFSYAVETGALQVFKNGLALHLGRGFTEQKVNAFALTEAADALDEILAVGFVGIEGTVDVRDTDIFLDNYQSLRDYVGTEDTIYIQGTATKGDGGESFFQEFTGAALGYYVDNNDTIIVPTGGDGTIGWVRRNYISSSVIYTADGTDAVASNVQAKLRERVSVKDFGATGDGVTDDTDAIQNALSYGGELFFPAGTYLVDTTLTASLSRNLSLIGTGNSIISFSIANSAGLVITADQNNVNISGLIFDGNSVTSVCIDIIEEELEGFDVYVNDSHFKNMYSTDGGNSIGLMIRGGFRNVNVENSSFVNATRLIGTGTPGVASSAGIVITKWSVNDTFVKHGYIRGCYIKDITNGETSATAFNTDADGIKVFGDNSPPDHVLTSFIIEACRFVNCKGRAIKGQVDKMTVSGCHIYRNIAGITASTEINLQISSGKVIDCTFTYEDSTSGEATFIRPITAISLYASTDPERVRMYDVSNITVFNDVASSELAQVINATSGYVTRDNDIVLNIDSLEVNSSVEGLVTITGHITADTGNYYLNMSNVYVKEVTDGLVGHNKSTADRTKTIANLTNIVNAGAAIKATFNTTTPTSTAPIGLGLQSAIGVLVPASKRDASSGVFSLSPEDKTSSHVATTFFSEQIADAATVEFPLKLYTGIGTLIISANINQHASAIVTKDSAGLVALLESATPVNEYGNTTNPNVAGKLNFWYDSEILYINNQLGSSRMVSVLSIG